jgi:hypothetical protein
MQDQIDVPISVHIFVVTFSMSDRCAAWAERERRHVDLSDIDRVLSEYGHRDDTPGAGVHGIGERLRFDVELDPRH